jgi:hypothetical protein
MDLIRYRWKRDKKNPVIRPGSGGDYNCSACMTPAVVARDSEYWLYYAGGDSEGRRRICLAIAPQENPTEFRHVGPILPQGEDADFDAKYQVCPRPFLVGDTWYMIYTGLPKAGWGVGLSTAIKGLGMAVSDDGLNWRKLGMNRTLHGDQFEEYPGNSSIGGGGPPLWVEDDDRGPRFRLYCSLPVGRPSKDRRIDQEKLSIVAHSADGQEWSDFRIVMRRRPELDWENCSSNYPLVWRDGDLFRCLYCSGGTRWGYSIAEAVSRDGYEWYRGKGGDDNLSLAPTDDDSWEGQMTGYPTIAQEGEQLRLYYCGNGWGSTGIGTAVAAAPSQAVGGRRARLTIQHSA